MATGYPIFAVENLTVRSEKNSAFAPSAAMLPSQKDCVRSASDLGCPDVYPCTPLDSSPLFCVAVTSYVVLEVVNKLEKVTVMALDFHLLDKINL